jgi:hypothetical protein
MKAASISSYAADEAKWRTESDLRALQDAEAIKKDPKRFKACQELAKKKLMEMASIAGDAEHGKG